MQKLDIDQLKADPTRWQEIKALSYAEAKADSVEAQQEKMEQIAKLTGLPDCSPGHNYSETYRVRMCAIAEDL